MTHELSDDVPSPIDLRNRADANAWVASTITRRPERPRFFDAIASHLDNHFEDAFSVVELGSGPGHLAKVILDRCCVSSYTALDFSDEMHTLAKEHLGPSGERVCFLNADLREDWSKKIGRVDAIVTMQAVHEVRHKRHQPAVFAKVLDALRPDGLFLYCDHYFEAGGTKHPDLYFDRTEQPKALTQAGFTLVEAILDYGGMALFACRPPIE